MARIQTKGEALKYVQECVNTLRQKESERDDLNREIAKYEDEISRFCHQFLISDEELESM